MKAGFVTDYRSLLMKMLFVAAFIGFCFSFHSVASANNTTYYINNQSGSGCSNGGAGTSTGAPWCDFTPVNSHTFLPGDQILLARGATWNQELKLNGTGTSGSWITVNAYGSGNRPKIIRSGHAADVGVRLTNPDYWSINNLEVGSAGEGILVRVTSTSHNGLAMNNIYVHNITGIYDFTGYAGPGYATTQDSAGTSQSAADGTPNSSGIMILATNVTVDVSEYLLGNINLSHIEGTHNMISVDFEVGPNITLTGTGDLSNVFQNITLSYLNLHDDDGPSISCPDSLGLIGTSNALVMNSQLNNEAACHGVNGTASIFVGRTKNVNFINNVITNTADTGSTDQTGVDYEALTETTNFKGNYFGGNAGPGVEFLGIHGSTDHSINNEISGNLFAGNPVSIRRWGDDILPTGTIKDNLSADAVFYSGDFTGYTDTNNITDLNDTYNAAYHFGNTQGANSWSYQSTSDGTNWSNLSYYDSAAQAWQPSSSVTTPQVAQFDMQPGNSSTAYAGRAWTASANGEISIRGIALKSVITGGDGVNVRITKNGSTIWPTGGGWQSMAYNNQTGVWTNLDDVSVNAGDVVRFEVNEGSNNSYDTVSWSPSIAYTSLSAPPGNTWNFNTNGNTEGWTNENDISQSVSGGIDTLTSTGGDPYIKSSDNLNIASSDRYIKIKLKNNTSDTTAQFFFTTTSSTSFDGGKSVSFTIAPNASSYTEYVVDMGANSNWTGTIKQLRFDPFGTTGTMNVDYILVTDTSGSGGGSAPSAPTGLSATGGNGQASLSWSSSSGATGYKVKYGTSSGSYPNVIDVGNVTSKTVTGLTNGTTYYVVVTAYNSNGESGSSSQASAAPSSGGGGTIAYQWEFNTNGDTEGWTDGNDISQSVSGGINTVTSSGGDPYMYSNNNLGIANASTNRYVKIKLKNNTSNTGAQIFFITNSDTSYNGAKSVSFTTGASMGSYTEYVVDMGANANWTGTIKQLRFDPFGSTGTMGIDYIQVTNSSGSGGGGSAPSAPTGLSVTSGNGQASLSWSASSGATGYKVKYGTSSGSYPNVIDVGNVTGKTVTGLTNGTTYYFVVTAYNANGESGTSSQSSAAPSSGGGGGSPATYEAESASLSGGVSTNNNHTGYVGSGFTDNWTSVNGSATFTVAGGSGGSKTLIIRYANAQGDARTLSLYVNGVKIQQLSFPTVSHNNWDAWDTISQSVTLSSGSNTIKIQYDSGDSGIFNIDNITI